jgi:hypothetical protein
MATQPIFPDVIQSHVISVSDVDGTTLKTLVTAGTNGTRIDTISATSTDTVDAVLSLYHSDGTTDFLIGSVSIPASSGVDGTIVSVSVLNDTDLPFLRSDLAHYLANGHSLKVGVSTALSASTKIDLVAICGDY